MPQDEAEDIEYIELAIEPISPDTISSARAELVSIIQDALRESGQEQLLVSGDLQVEVEKTIPMELAVPVLTAALTLCTGVALETYKAIILPRLKKRFQVEEKRRRKAKGKKKS